TLWSATHLQPFWHLYRWLIAPCVRQQISGNCTAENSKIDNEVPCSGRNGYLARDSTDIQKGRKEREYWAFSTRSNEAWKRSSPASSEAPAPARSHPWS